MENMLKLLLFFYLTKLVRLMLRVQDLYSFFTQDMAKYFQCVFVFDFLHMKAVLIIRESYGRV